jgi:hypothetical protein
MNLLSLGAIVSAMIQWNPERLSIFLDIIYHAVTRNDILIPAV